MGKYRERNERTIERAFARQLADKDRFVEEGMRNLLQAAVDFALESHDAAHHLHLEIGDTYGWMLVHNGRVVDIAVTARDRMEGDAARQLEAMASSVRKRSWVGVVMAGLNHPDYYAVDYEKDILNGTIRMTPVFFQRYFKPLV